MAINSLVVVWVQGSALTGLMHGTTLGSLVLVGALSYRWTGRASVAVAMVVASICVTVLTVLLLLLWALGSAFELRSDAGSARNFHVGGTRRRAAPRILEAGFAGGVRPTAPPRVGVLVAAPSRLNPAAGGSTGAATRSGRRGPGTAPAR
jgi:hypothetical protein